MANDNFEAYAYTGFDWDNDDYTEDYPHRIVASVDGQIETWNVKGVGGFLRYYRSNAEPYTFGRWMERTNDETDSAIDDLTREDFDHYTASGLLFG